MRGLSCRRTPTRAQCGAPARRTTRVQRHDITMNPDPPLSRRRFACMLAGCGGALLCPPHRVPAWGAATRRSAVATAMGVESLKVRAGRTIDILERHVQTGYLTGAVALIGRDEHAQVVLVGEQAQESPGLMRRDSLFRIPSMTKPITAVATLML